VLGRSALPALLTLAFRQTTVTGVTAFSGNRESGAERRQQARKLILAKADVLT
jgi:hypothetical protein